MRNVPLDLRTRWRIGGQAPELAEASSQEELRGLLAELEGETALVLGGGANLLVSDQGPGAPVVVLGGEFKRQEVLEDTIRVGAAASIAGVVQAARRAARSGLWILEAVPGTMGGALRLNAGTADEWIWDRVLWAEVMLPDGSVERVVAEDVQPSYRAIELDPGAIFLRAEVRAPPADAARVRQEHMQRRIEKLRAQVYDKPTCGSTWKNPGAPSPSAWELVELVGMRGEKRGGAQVSPKHANFIVNLGDAKAQDVIDLMIETRRRVHEEKGIFLEPELHFWGFPGEVLRELGAGTT